MKQRFPVFLMLITTIILFFPIDPVSAESPGTTLESKIGTLAKEYRVQSELAAADAAFGLSVMKSAETWHLAALDIAGRMENEKATTYLNQVRKEYQASLASNPNPANMQLVGMDFLYKSLDVLAMLQARDNGDQNALKTIRETEKRLYHVVSQAKNPAAALPALAGGAMTMLAVIAGQADHGQSWAGPLNNELAKRKSVDDNITRLKNADAGEKILLLTNNYLQGALSMSQIIALASNAELKPKLIPIERELGKLREAEVQKQIIGASNALAETGFLAAPALAAQSRSKTGAN